MPLLERINYIKDERLVTIKALAEAKNNNKRLCLFGCGCYAEALTLSLEKYNVYVDSYCIDDAYYSEGNNTFMGKPVYPRSQIANMQEDIVVLIAFQNYKRAKEFMENWEFSCPVYYIDDLYFLFKMDFEYVMKNINALEEAYDMMSDDLSRDVMTAFINTRISGNPEEIFKLRSSEDCNYDYKLLDLNNNESFVDVGAFDGDSIRAFLQHVDGYNAIYAFEPDSANIEKLKSNLAGKEITVIPKGAWDKEDVLIFKSGSGDSSTFMNDEDNAITDFHKEHTTQFGVPVTSLDLALENRPVTFIKMDIEGSELKALKGAENTIKKNKPKMAICVYHKAEDLVTIPQYIKSLFEDDTYNYYMRHHSVSLAETVLYCIPKKRE